MLRNYQPGTDSQPAVSDKVGGVTAPAGTVTVATKCVIWISPFTGDLVFTSGSLTDQSTQRELAEFLTAAPRTTSRAAAACVSPAQDVGSANQRQQLPGQRPQRQPGHRQQRQPVLTGGGQRITGSGQSGGGGLNMPEFFGRRATRSSRSSRRPAGRTPPFSATRWASTASRRRPIGAADASLDQIGPAPSQYGAGRIGGQIDTIDPLAGARPDVARGRDHDGRDR